MAKKKEKPEVDEPAIEVKACSRCVSREEPNGKFPQRGWCNDPKSNRFQGYVYKGETCDKFKNKRGKRDSIEE